MTDASPALGMRAISEKAGFSEAGVSAPSLGPGGEWSWCRWHGSELCRRRRDGASFAVRHFRVDSMLVRFGGTFQIHEPPPALA